MKSKIANILSVATLLLLVLPRATQAQTTMKSGDTTQPGFVVARKAGPERPVAKPPAVKPKAITKEFSGGLRLNTDGWTAVLEKGYLKSKETKNKDKFFDVLLFQFEFSERRHPKEIKAYGSEQQSSDRTFIYGKVNNFYSVKLNVGKRKMIAGKPEPGCVSVHWVYGGGAAIGMLKPYYLDVVRSSGTQESIKYTPETQSDFLNVYNILGSSGFSTGLGEMKFIPGLHVKSALHFDFAASKKAVTAVEAGFTAEFYSQEIELMATQPKQSFFFNLYAGIQFGKRW